MRCFFSVSRIFTRVLRHDLSTLDKFSGSRINPLDLLLLDSSSSFLILRFRH